MSCRRTVDCRCRRLARVLQGPDHFAESPILTRIRISINLCEAKHSSVASPYLVVRKISIKLCQRCTVLNRGYSLWFYLTVRTSGQSYVELTPSNWGFELINCRTFNPHYVVYLKIDPANEPIGVGDSAPGTLANAAHKIGRPKSDFDLLKSAGKPSRR